MKAIPHILTAAFLFFVLPLAHATSTPTPETARVTRVVDGDTFKAKIGTKIESIRIIGIDTPETKDPRKPVQCFGKEAAGKLRKLLQKKTITLERNPAEDRDKYRRLLRYVALDGKDIGATMIEEGYAFSYRQYPHPRLEVYDALEHSARDASMGLWGSCPASNGKKRTSGQQRGTQGQTSSGNASSPAQSRANTQQCTIKGNISAKGEKIYHLPGCGSYSATQIDEDAGERWFCSENEATSAGWRRAGNC